MYRIILGNKAKRQLAKLPQEIQHRIGNVIERLKIRPFSIVKKLANSSYFRARIGDYRLILNIIENKLIIYVIEVGHRKMIYK